MTNTQSQIVELPLKTSRNGDGREGGKLREEANASHSETNSPRLNVPAEGERLPPPKAARRPWVWALAGIGAVVVVGIGVSYYFYSLSFESTDDAFVDGHIVPVSARVAGHVAKVYVTDNQWVNQGDLLAELDPHDFQARLAASEAALVAARAGRKSRSIGVDVTEITSTAGMSEASAGVEGAKAAVETARAAVATAKSQHVQAEAQLMASEAAVEQARADVLAAEARRQHTKTHLQRIQALVPDHAASQDSLDEASAADGVAEADVAAMRQKVNAQEAAVKQFRAAVAAAESGVRQAESGVAARLAAQGIAEAQFAGSKSAPRQVAQGRSQTDAAEADAARTQADLNQAELNLSYTKIYAPISGHVTRKSVEQGAYVQTGQPLLALVDPDVWVIANFKETQLDKMRPGQPVTVTVDAHPGVKLAAHVDSLQRGSGARFSLLPPENATGNYVKVVQRVPVKVVFDDLKQVEEYGLGPGMSVFPTVTLSEQSRGGRLAVSGVSISR